MTESAHEENPPVVVERRDYQQFFIEVEIYKQRGGGFHAWPYIGFEGQHHAVKHHFLLNQETYPTRQAALEAAILAGQAKIDGGYDPRRE